MTAEPNKQPAEPSVDGPAVDQPVAGAAPANGDQVPPVADAERLAKLEGEVASLKDQLLRAVAETENVRRRAERERDDTAKFAVSKFAKDLLAVGDNLRRALEAVPADARSQDDVLGALLTGVEATERQLAAAFERVGIKKMDVLGESFDPNFHQVMFEIENAGKPGGVIVQVLQDGYTLHGRLLREAMVGVAKGEAAASGQGHVNTTA